MTEETSILDEKKEQTKNLEEANKVLKELEDTNARMNRALTEREELLNKAKMGGRSLAGQTPQLPKPETPKEYAEKVMSGKMKNA